MTPQDGQNLGAACSLLPQDTQKRTAATASGDISTTLASLEGSGAVLVGGERALATRMARRASGAVTTNTGSDGSSNVSSSFGGAAAPFVFKDVGLFCAVALREVDASLSASSSASGDDASSLAFAQERQQQQQQARQLAQHAQYTQQSTKRRTRSPSARNVLHQGADKHWSGACA